MQAAMLLEPGRLEQVELPEPPDPMAGEALVAVRRVGICGTDFHAYASTQNFFAYPRVLGHELAVEVLELGPGTADRSLSLLTTVQLPRQSAMAAIWRSTCWMMRPLRRSSA